MTMSISLMHKLPRKRDVKMNSAGFRGRRKKRLASEMHSVSKTAETRKLRVTVRPRKSMRAMLSEIVNARGLASRSMLAYSNKRLRLRRSACESDSARPTKITGADSSKSANRSRRNKKNKGSGKGRSCFICGRTGHIAANCWDNPNSNTLPPQNPNPQGNAGAYVCDTVPQPAGIPRLGGIALDVNVK